MQARILGWPCCAMGRRARSEAADFGLSTSVPLFVRSIAVAITFALRRCLGVLDWQSQLDALRDSAAVHLRAGDWHAGKVEPSWWRTSSIAQFLADAARGFQDAACSRGRAAYACELREVGGAMLLEVRASPEFPTMSALHAACVKVLRGESLQHLLCKRARIISHLPISWRIFRTSSLKSSCFPFRGNSACLGGGWGPF